MTEKQLQKLSCAQRIETAKLAPDWSGQMCGEAVCVPFQRQSV